MQQNILVYVGGGYSVPATGTPDGNITRYIQSVIDDLGNRIDRRDSVTVVFLGGATNPKFPNITEAEVLSHAWRHLVPLRHITETMEMVLCTQGLDLRDNLVAFRAYAAEQGNVCNDALIFYCEKHRHRRFAYLASEIFPGTEKPRIYTIDFDERSTTWRDHATRWVEYWITQAGRWIPDFYRKVERPLRMWKIGRDPKTERILPR